MPFTTPLAIPLALWLCSEIPGVSELSSHESYTCPVRNHILLVKKQPLIWGSMDSALQSCLLLNVIQPWDTGEEAMESPWVLLVWELQTDFSKQANLLLQNPQIKEDQFYLDFTLLPSSNLLVLPIEWTHQRANEPVASFLKLNFLWYYEGWEKVVSGSGFRKFSTSSLIICRLDWDP